MGGALEFGHGDRLNRLLSEPPEGTCAHLHPVVDGVRCERSRGHEGSHLARLRSADREVTLQWTAGESVGESIEVPRPPPSP